MIRSDEEILQELSSYIKLNRKQVQCRAPVNTIAQSKILVDMLEELAIHRGLLRKRDA
jgi:hypothetical protein